eukprot:gene22947-30130_t
MQEALSSMNADQEGHESQQTPPPSSPTTELPVFRLYAAFKLTASPTEPELSLQLMARLASQLGTPMEMNLMARLASHLGTPMEMNVAESTASFFIMYEGSQLLMQVARSWQWLLGVGSGAQKTYSDYPWSPRWSADEMASRIVKWAKEELPTFLKQQPTNGVSPINAVAIAM